MVIGDILSHAFCTIAGDFNGGSRDWGNETKGMAFSQSFFSKDLTVLYDGCFLLFLWPTMLIY